MPKFTLKGKAKSDLKDIARFTQKRWGREQRNKYLTLLDNSFRRLAENPDIGKDCGEIKEGYQKFPTGSHVIYYRCPGNAPLEIVRILQEGWMLNCNFQQATLSDNSENLETPEFSDQN